MSGSGSRGPWNDYDARYRTCPPGSAPGGVWVRVVADDGTLVRERALRRDVRLEALAVLDAEEAIETMERTQQPVRLYAYDGDSGECICTIVSEP